MIYFARKQDCHACALKPQCCPNVPARKIARSVHEAARDKARAIAKTEAYAVSCRERKKVEMLFAHLKRILRLGRLRLRGPNGAKDEFLLAATAQNLRKLAKLIPFPEPIFATEAKRPGLCLADSATNPKCSRQNRGFFNKIGKVEMWRGDVRLSMSVSAPFVWRCLSGSTVAPFPHPAHRTGHADFPHPALGQDLTPSFACDAIGSF